MFNVDAIYKVLAIIFLLICVVLLYKINVNAVEDIKTFEGSVHIKGQLIVDDKITLGKYVEGEETPMIILSPRKDGHAVLILQADGQDNKSSTIMFTVGTQDTPSILLSEKDGHRRLLTSEINEVITSEQAKLLESLK